MNTVTVKNINPQVIVNIDAELEIAKKHQEHFASPHEAYAVILEELDEFWETVKTRKEHRNLEVARLDLVSIAAMAIKALQSPVLNS